MFMGCLSSEDVVAIAGIAENDRQHDDRSDQEQGLGLGCSGSLPKVDLKWNQPGPHADPQPDVVHQKEPQAQEKRSELALAAVQVPPQQI